MLANGRDLRHVENVREGIEKLVARCSEISRATVNAFRQRRLQDDGVSPSTVNKQVGYLRACLAWAEEIERLDYNPIAGLNQLRVRPCDLRKRRRPLAGDERSRFLRAAKAIDEERAARWQALRSITRGRKSKAWSARRRRSPVPQHPLWWTKLVTGLRWGELVSLRGCDILEAALVVRSKTTKTGVGREVPIPPALARVLREMANGVEPLFRKPHGQTWKPEDRSNARWLFLRVLERAKIPRFDADERSIDMHALRLTCSTHLMRKGAGIAQVARLLGHSDSRTTYKHYTQFCAEDLRDTAALGWDVGDEREE